jgi:2-oxoglutarate ferredoxin oxidoreductase subunit gamma
LRRELILSGEGGQGLILAGAILAEAAGVYEGYEVVQTQSYGIQARGGASQSTVIVSDRRIKFPEVLSPELILCLSQEAYFRYSPKLQVGGVLLVDRHLVEVKNNHRDIEIFMLEFTSEAEKLGRRIAANMIALGAITAISGIVKSESIIKVIPRRLSNRNVPTALQALEVGVQMGKAA